MSQTKFKLQEDVKIMCISLVRGYKRRIKLYQRKRYEAMHSNPSPPDGLPRATRTSDITASKALKLNEIENEFNTKAIKAVEQAKLIIGKDLPENQRQLLARLIWDCCIEGKNFSFYQRKSGLNIEKTSFYHRRGEFLYNIAKNMDFL